MDDDFTGEDVEVSAGVTLDGAQDAPSDAYETVETVDPVTEEDVLDETDGGDQGDDPEVINENTATLDTTVNVVEGDRVIITLIDGEPVVTGVVGGGDNMAADVASAVEAAETAGETATAYITEIDSNGISVHAENNVDTNYAQINANGMEVIKGGTSVAQFGSTARIGSATGQNVKIDSDSIDICAGTTVNATFGSTNINIGTWDSVIHAGDEKSITFFDGSGEITCSIGETRDSMNIESGALHLNSYDGVYVSDALHSEHNIAVIGDFVSKDQTTNVSCVNTGWTNVTSITVDAGTWVVSANLNYANNSTGRRVASISTTSGSYDSMCADQRPPTSGAATWMNLCRVLTTSTSKTVYLTAWQNSGAALNATGYLRAVRIK